MACPDWRVQPSLSNPSQTAGVGGRSLRPARVFVGDMLSGVFCYPADVALVSPSAGCALRPAPAAVSVRGETLATPVPPTPQLVRGLTDSRDRPDQPGPPKCLRRILATSFRFLELSVREWWGD